VAFGALDHVTILVDAGQQVDRVKQIIDTFRIAYVWTPITHPASMLGGENLLFIESYVLKQMRHSNFAEMHPELQLMLTTSGTTGSSKFVRISGRSVRANAESIKSYLGIRSSDVAITTLPFSYSFGLSIVNSHLAAGAAIATTELTLLQREFWDFVDKAGVTSLSGVPYTFQMLKKIGFEQRRLNTIRYLTQAGGKPGKDLIAYLQSVSKLRSWPCYLMYGQTEATARISYLPPERLFNSPESIGSPIPGGRLSLIDENGSHIEECSIVGELVYYGENVAMGYAAKNADLLEGDHWEGELHTGDLAYRDEDGLYYIVGRSKRILKLFGKRLSLDELEYILAEMYPACEFACLGQDDALVIAFMGKERVKDIVQRVSEELSVNRSAIKAIQLTEIPRLVSGKVDFAAIERQALFSQ
jgi:acyl-coenzyme A synthetase/AMP-(fatty) acid ligase